MFQQFKNIFPNASLNISSITSSISIPETSLNRLEAIKSEFSNLNSLLHNQPELDETAELPQPTKPSVKELEATGQIIQRIQEGVENIDQANQNNYRRQKVADHLLGKLQHTGQLHYKVCEQIENSGNEMSDIQNHITRIQDTATKLINTLAALEQQINQVNLINEQKEFELWKQKEEEELMKEINAKRQTLKEKEMNLKQRYEECESIQQKKKLELYEATFNAELEEYKRKRETEISSLYSKGESASTLQTSLEQLHLENDGKDELEDFFGESGTKKANQPKETDSLSSDDERIDILRDEDYDDF